VLIEAYSTVKLVKVFGLIVYWLLKASMASRVTLTVPVPVNVPAPPMTLEGSGVKVELSPTVNVWATLKLDEVVTVEAVVKL